MIGHAERLRRLDNTIWALVAGVAVIVLIASAAGGFHIVLSSYTAPAGIGLLLGTVVCRNAGTMLVAHDTMSRADAIYVLDGAFMDRVVEAADLFRAGFAPRVAQEAIQMQTVVSLVSSGLGVALVPACLANLGRRGVVYRDISDPHPKLDLWLAWRRGPGGITASVPGREFVTHAKRLAR